MDGEEDGRIPTQTIMPLRAIGWAFVWAMPVYGMLDLGIWLIVRS